VPAAGQVHLATVAKVAGRGPDETEQQERQQRVADPFAAGADLRVEFQRILAQQVIRFKSLRGGRGLRCFALRRGKPFGNLGFKLLTLLLGNLQPRASGRCRCGDGNRGRHPLPGLRHGSRDGWRLTALLQRSATGGAFELGNIREFRNDTGFPT